MDALRKTLEDVKTRIARWQGRKLNEENTKATLIDPVLRAMGWDLEDMESVQHEYKVKRRDKPVDYALFSDRKPVLFVEAKALGQDLGDRRWANQIMGYASVAGVPWVVLTNGDEYQVYNAHAAVPVDRKMFRTVSITASPEEATVVLGLIVPSRMVDTDLEKLWQVFYVDQEVRTAVEDLFGSGVPNQSLVSLVKRQTKGLTAGEIRSSLARVRVALEFPALRLPEPRIDRPEKRKNPSVKPPQRLEISLRDLVDAGILKPPLELQATYKKREFSARVESDGQVSFRGERFDSPSPAAGAARATVIGTPAGKKYPPTNGWAFWQFVDRDGETKEIGELRNRYPGRKDLKVVGKAEPDRKSRGGR